MGKKPILNSNDSISKIVDILGLEPHIPQQTTIKTDLTREKSVHGRYPRINKDCMSQGAAANYFLGITECTSVLSC